jgi:hypothetical protein
LQIENESQTFRSYLKNKNTWFRGGLLPGIRRKFQGMAGGRRASEPSETIFGIGAKCIDKLILRQSQTYRSFKTSSS